MLVDLRNNKNVFPGKYKGFCGAVKSVACPSNQSLVVSASLDRHFRIHDFTTRKLLVKVCTYFRKFLSFYFFASIISYPSLLGIHALQTYHVVTKRNIRA